MSDQTPELRFSQAGLASVQGGPIYTPPVRGHDKPVRLIDPAAIDESALLPLFADAHAASVPRCWCDDESTDIECSELRERLAEAVKAHLVGGAR